MDPSVAPHAAASLRTQLRELRATGRAEFYERVDLRAWTALRLGGTADLVIRCRSLDGTAQVLDLLAAHGLSWIVIGTGSRLLAPDSGLRVPVLTFGGELARWQREDDVTVVGAGASLDQLARSLSGHGVLGVERLIGTTGSLGGTFARDLLRRTSSVVTRRLRWYECAAPGRPIRRMTWDAVQPPPDLGRWVVVRAGLELTGDAIDEAADVGGRRTRPGADGTVGPVFSAPEQEQVDVSELLTAAGCADLGRGGVRSLRTDPNRLRVSRAGSSSDVLSLIRRMRDRVEERYGVRLPVDLDPVDELGRSLVP